MGVDGRDERELERSRFIYCGGQGSDRVTMVKSDAMICTGLRVHSRYHVKTADFSSILYVGQKLKEIFCRKIFSKYKNVFT